jgi:hypothetical protein
VAFRKQISDLPLFLVSLFVVLRNVSLNYGSLVHWINFSIAAFLFPVAWPTPSSGKTFILHDCRWASKQQLSLLIARLFNCTYKRAHEGVTRVAPAPSPRHRPVPLFLVLSNVTPYTNRTTVLRIVHPIHFSFFTALTNH